MDGLGDALACVPALEGLRRAHPDARFGAVLSPGNAGAFSTLVERRFFVERRGEYEPLVDAVREARYDTAIVATEEPAGYALAARAGISRRVGFWHRFEKPLKSLWQRRALTRAVYRPAAWVRRPEHEAQTIYRLALAAGAAAPAPRDPASLSAWLDVDRSGELTTARPRLGVQIARKLALGDWGPAALAQLVAHAFRSSGFASCALLCSPNDEDFARALVAQMPAADRAAIQLATSTSMAAWFGALHSLDALLTPDTGAAHAAGMLGTPTVDLFESDGFERLSRQWSPWAAPSACLVKAAHSPGAERSLGERIGAALQDVRKPGRAAYLAPSRVLAVCTGGGFGDLLAATPAMRALARHFQTRVDVLTSSYAAPILDGHPAIGDVLVDDGVESAGAVAQRLRARAYTHAVVFWSTARVAAIVAAARIPMRVGQARRLYSGRYTHPVRVRSELGDETSHWTDIQMDYARALGAQPQAADYDLIVAAGDADRSAARDALRAAGVDGPYAVLHATRGLDYRRVRWPTQRFAELGDAMARECDVAIALTGSAREAPIVDDVAARMREPHASLAGALDLRGLCGLLANARAVIALDSGPMHVAAALRVPTVGIFALRTDLPQRWRPLGPRVAVIEPAYPCPGCRKETCRTFDCYAALDTGAVIATLRRVLALEPAPS